MASPSACIMFRALRAPLRHRDPPPASQRKHRCDHLLLQFLEICLLEGLEAFEQLEHSCFCLLPQCCFHSFTRFHVQGVSSLLFTLLGFADEDTPVLFICLQLFHTPSGQQRLVKGGQTE